MNQTMRAAIGVILVLVIVFSAINICQNIAKQFKLDITDQKLYTLSDGTKSVLSKLNQPVTARLYYTKTAAMRGPDQIRFFNNYYQYVKALLEQYVAASSGMFQLEIIDPRPYSDEELEAVNYGLTRYSIDADENFFFGLVLQTQFGVEKSIPFFSPDRQQFIEYDISYLIDTAVTRQKQKIGVLSSLPMMGDDVTDYMAQLMRQQGQTPRQPWTIIEHLRRKYEVSAVAADTSDINDVDILMVVHPKDLPEQTLFAIDQFILKGGRTIILIDPYCYTENISSQAAPTAGQPRNSRLDKFINNWGLKMPQNTFAGDRELAEIQQVSASNRAQTIIGLLTLTDGCFNKDNVITTQLDEVRVLFAGALKEINDPNQPVQGNITRTPLMMTTDKGNTFSVNSVYELTVLDPDRLMNKFSDGNTPVVMGYQVTGRFNSCFPDGVEIETESDDPNNPTTTKMQGLTESQEDCSVVVFSDVDFISDVLAYSSTFFGTVIVGDNSTLLLNTIDDLCGSSDLISIRSRGNAQKPFIVVDEIERLAEAETQAELSKLDLAIATYNAQLQDIVSSAQGQQQALISQQIAQQQRELQNNLYQAEREKRLINLKRSELIDSLGTKLERINTLAAPAVILVIAVMLGIRGALRKRHYISHKSDS